MEYRGLLDGSKEKFPYYKVYDSPIGKNIMESQSGNQSRDFGPNLAISGWSVQEDFDRPITLLDTPFVMECMQ